ncbi:MAG TPA: hypothetical protein VIB11_05780 [Pedococcus sp.]|jgi:hypothetical protein|uniref:hypothetical protein n=1 Tax=Pedococcus sp. TaxID=2860345 RepID=UPI002F944745
MNPDWDEPSTRRVVLAAAAVATVVGALTVSLWWFTNIGLLLATLACAAVVALVAQRLVQSQRRMHWTTAAHAPEERRGADARVGTVHHTIEQATRGEAAAVHEVHALLTTLAEERLRDSRGLDRRAAGAAGAAGAAAATEAALGADLAAYLDRPPGGRITPDQLRRHLTTLEELS